MVQDIPDQKGRSFVITGGGGIGTAVAAGLVAAGASVLLAVRDPVKARRLVGTAPEIARLDLADLASVRSFAANLPAGIDVLVNNAGVIGRPLSYTVDGFEHHLGVNHLGHFALTGLLLAQVRDRIVTVSSLAHRTGRLDFSDPHWRHRRYDPQAAYAASKLAVLLFTVELQRRFGRAGSTRRAIASHPGMTATDQFAGAAWTAQLRVMHRAQQWFGQHVAAGALPILYAATADLPGGCYIGPRRFFQTRGEPTIVDSSPASKDPDLAQRLWDLSEHDTNVHYQMP
jgi:NAD(P)-dependent dehydrogenase (short-subunit alcohol dehydrogenase family)